MIFENPPGCPANLFDCIVLVDWIPFTGGDIIISPFITLSVFSCLLGRCLRRHISVFSSVQFSSIEQSCPTLWDPMDCSMPGLPVYRQLPEFTQTHVHWVGDAIQPSHPLSSPSPPALNFSPASESFPMSQLFAWGGQSTGVSALAYIPSCLDFLPM